MQDAGGLVGAAAKVIGAVLRVLVALAFGAVGACGVWVTIGGLWDTIRRQITPEGKGWWLYGVICAVFGLAIAWRLARTAATMLRKRGNRDE